MRLSLSMMLVASLLFLAACGSGSKQPTTPAPSTGNQGSTTPAPTAPQPKKGGTLVFLGHHELAGLGPADVDPTVTWSMITQMHNALLEVDHNYELDKVLAEDYSVSADGKEITFKLRKGVKFHDGTLFTAKDVKYTYDFYGDPANATAILARFSNVAKTEVVDDHTVKVTLKTPDATFLRQAATTFIVNSEHHKKIGEAAYKANPNGTGPFKLKEYKANEFTLVEAFADHFRGRPHVDFIRMNVVPEPSVRSIALQTGQGHTAVWPVLNEDNLKMEKDTAKFKVYRTPSVSVNHFPLNTKLPQLSDKRVRQAMMHATDRQRMINDVFSGAAQIAHSNLAPALEFWYEPNVKKYEYDVNKAKALLDEAGWRVGADGVREKGGQKLQFTLTVISGDQVRKPQAEFLQQSLQQVGFKIDIREAPTATILAALPKGEMDASLFNWTYGGTGGEPDPSVTLRTGAARNFSNWSHPRVDELITLGRAEMDPAKRAVYYKEIQRIFAEEVPFLPMSYWDWFNVFSVKVKGLPDKVAAGSNMYRLAYQWWLD